jgi:hypothetical protein
MNLTDIEARVRERLLDHITAQVRSAGTGHGDLGPACSAFYLLHYEYRGSGIDARTEPLSEVPQTPDDSIDFAAILKAMDAEHSRLSRDRVLGLWRVTLSGVEAIPIEIVASVSVGETRGALFENAKVSLWIDADRALAYVDWVYGPLYARGFTYEIRRNGDSVSLENVGLRWMS